MMRLLLAVFCAVVLASSPVSSADSSVRKLTRDTIDEAIENTNALVLFYVDWCGHCAAVKPILEELSPVLDALPISVSVLKVNCEENGDLCAKYGVKGYPTISLFKPGEETPAKYLGPRTRAGIVDFVETEAKAPLEVVPKLRSNKEGEEAEAEEEEGVEGLQSPDKEPLPALVELTEENFAKHVSSGNHFVKFFAPWCSHCQRLAPTWDELAKSLQQNEAVSIAKIDCTLYRSICQDFEVKGYPTLLWIEDGKKIEKYAGSREHDALKAYVEKMLGTESKQDAPEPEEQVPEADQAQALKKDVVQLSGDDFAKTIKEGVTFVKFYAPWCGHCQNLSPTWDQLAEKIHNVISGVKIAKVDCTAAENRNLCVNEEVEGYPTLFAYKNGEKQSEYHGSRSLAELQQYIKKFVGHDEL